MLRDALAAEFYRSTRRWPLVFWGFAFVPLCSLLISISLQFKSFSIPGASDHVDLAGRLMRELANTGSPFAQVFFILAAALIFGADFDGQPAAGLAPRASRADFIWAKALMYTAGVFVSLSMLILSAGISALLTVVRLRAPILWQVDGGSPLMAVGLQLGVSWLELTLLGLIAGAAAMALRSALIGAVSVIFLAFCQALLASSVSMRHASLLLFAGLPAFSVEMMRFYLAHRAFAPARYVTNLEALKATLALALWMSATLSVLLLRFSRQKPARE
jgi:hypothetical protein